MYVCERLGYPDEKIIQRTPEKIAEPSFADPNVVIVIKDREQDRQKDICFRPSRGRDRP